ncbi:MAG: hypothetical protein AUI36_03715 [Cyanobacteria bacterium 13_1_40CM_2_61_4]|nr:MAG: hypothetical protein AUI36_03715 [Cyanobacteria bacterium 13_1_40CM_2_61_4]
MFKSIRNLVSSLKERFFSEPLKLFDAVVLIVMAGLGLGMEISNVLGRHPSPEATIHLTLAVLALMGLHFCIERFSVMNRMERRTAFLDLAGVKPIPKAIQCEIEELMKFRHALRKLESQTQQTNEEFGDIAVGILKEHTRQLRGLSEGRLNVPREWKIISYQKLMNHYKDRFDAVSEDDLNYWASPASDAEEYLEIAEGSYRQHHTQLTRIFVLNLTDLKLKPSSIIRVLRRQEQAGIGWAVAIREVLPYEVKHREIPLDFVLHNGNKAVSLSRKRDRRYETIFATDNAEGLRLYQQTYKDIIPACWLVNQRYIDNYMGALPDRARDENDIKQLAQERNKKLDGLTEIETPDGVFMLVVTKPEETAAKVKKLVKIADDYFRPTRRKVTYPAVLRKVS